MHRVSKWIAVFAAVVAPSLLSEVAHAQGASPDPALTDAARDLFVAGVEAANAGDWKTCRAKHLAALQLKVHWQIAVNLAECEAELGQHREAAEHLELAIRGMPAEEADRKAKAEALLARVKPFVAEVTLSVEGEGAEGAVVSVDGVEVGKAPIGRPLFLAPGPHTIEVRSKESSQSSTLEATAGGSHPVTLSFEGAGSITDPPPPVVTPVDDGAPIWPYFAFGGVAVAGLGVGIGFMVASGGAGSDREDLLGTLGGSSACSGATPPADCGEVKSLSEDENTFRGVGIGGFVVAGLGAIGLVTYAVLSSGSDSSASQQGHVRIAPSIAPGNTGVNVSGAF